MSDPFHKVPAWQIERVQVLQRACRSFEGRIGRGERRCKAAKRVAARYHGKPFKADPSHNLSLRPVTLRHWYRAWKEGGKVSGVFRLKYHPNQPTVRAAVFIRFTNFICSRRLSSMRAAWTAFQKVDADAGKVSYGKALYWLSAGPFYQIQAQLVAMETARRELAQLKIQTIGTVRERLPERLGGRGRK
ncbi:MAG TPA: hypothetical protein VGN23_13135 [Verrucomicrobiae bacterium]|jgi:hypothetical protein